MYGWGLLHINWFGDAVGSLAASGVCRSDVQVKGLRGALVVEGRGIIIAGNI